LSYWDFSAAITSNVDTLFFEISDTSNSLHINFDVSFVSFALDGPKFWDDTARIASDGLTYMAGALADEVV